MAISLVLRLDFSNLCYGTPASPEEFVEECLGRAADTVVERVVRSVADIDRIWFRDCRTGQTGATFPTSMACWPTCKPSPTTPTTFAIATLSVRLWSRPATASACSS